MRHLHPIEVIELRGCVYRTIEIDNSRMIAHPILRFATVSNDPRWFPQKAHPNDAAYDLKTRVAWRLEIDEVVSLKTGLFIEIPPGWRGDILPRSGLSGKRVFALYGCIDPGFRGELQVRVWNQSRMRYIIHVGDRIAQLSLTKIAHRPKIEVVSWENLTPSYRGSRGFGSSGV